MWRWIGKISNKEIKDLVQFAIHFHSPNITYSFLFLTMVHKNALFVLNIVTNWIEIEVTIKRNQWMEYWKGMKINKNCFFLFNSFVTFFLFLMLFYAVHFFPIAMKNWQNICMKLKLSWKVFGVVVVLVCISLDQLYPRIYTL